MVQCPFCQALSDGDPEVCSRCWLPFDTPPGYIWRDDGAGLGVFVLAHPNDVMRLDGDGVGYDPFGGDELPQVEPGPLWGEELEAQGGGPWPPVIGLGKAAQDQASPEHEEP